MSVEYETRGEVGLVTLDRPDRFNSIEPSLSNEMVAAMGTAADEARAVVLTGSGKAFCAGADLAALAPSYQSGGPDLGAYLEDVFHPMVHALSSCPIPVVAAVNGVAAGAGLGIALGCDLRVMAESSFLTSAFTAIGLAPDSGTTWWLPQMVGVSRAMEWALTNKRVSAAEAHQLGLCVEVTPDGEVVDRAIALAATLADLVPDALVTTRRLIREGSGTSFEEQLRSERREQARLGKTEAHAEGVAAFLEKRKPDFRSH